MEDVMSNKNIVRAWKDPAYRNSLSASERAALPPNPAGAIEISDADLGKVAAGLDPVPFPKTSLCSLGCPTLGCSWFNCSQLNCATALPLCPVKK
jgi:mersacidin/lichenicidin family type 2 lantibiotic